MQGQPQPPDSNLFEQLLFSQEGLDLNKQHQLLLTNKYTTSTPSYVDVDYIVITSGDGVAQYVSWTDLCGYSC